MAPSYNLERTLVYLGFRPARCVVELLASLRIHRPASLHLDVARRLSADPLALRRVQGVPLGEFLVDLMGFERVCRLLTRRFFKTFSPRPEQEEPIWWAAEHLERALQVSAVDVRRIDSVTQLLHDGERARQLLVRAGTSLLPEPPPSSPAIKQMILPGIC